MKYWRGYLVAAILGAIAWGITMLAKKFTTLVDMVFPYVTRTVLSFLTDWSSSASFCVWQVALVLFLVICLATLVLLLVLQ